MIIALTVVSTILCLVTLFTLISVAAALGQLNNINTAIREIYTLNKEQMNHYTTLSKYVLDLSVVAENLSETVQELTQALYENSFKMVRDGNKIFGGFSAEDIAEKMNKNDYNLTDGDINQLRDLFLGMDEEEDDDDDMEDGKETL